MFGFSCVLKMNSQFIIFDYYIFGMQDASTNKSDPKVLGNAVLYKLNDIKCNINFYVKIILLFWRCNII